MKSILKSTGTAALLLIACLAQAQHNGYHIKKVFHIASAGGWDYLAIEGNELYVSHGSQVNVLNKESGDSIGVIPNTGGVHGIAFISSLNKGFTSNGKLNTVTVFDLSTHATLSQIATGQNPDAILYDAFSKRIITCNGRSNDLSIIDPVTQKVISTIAVGGKPETAVSDGKGNLFVNIEDKSELVKVSLADQKVQYRWALAPAEGPTGLAFDEKNDILFAGCDQQLAVVDGSNGKLIDRVKIGDGCDGVAFDPATATVFASNGDGTLDVIKESAPRKYTVIQNMASKKGARTIALDPQTHLLYLPTADFQPNTEKGKRPAMVPGTFQVLVAGK